MKANYVLELIEKFKKYNQNAEDIDAKSLLKIKDDIIKEILIIDFNHIVILEMALRLALDEEVIVSGKAVELIKIIGNVKNTTIAEYASQVAQSKIAIKSGKVVELTEIVANAKGNAQAVYASYVARNSAAVESGKVVELTEKVANAKGETQARSAKEVARNKDAIESGKVVELTKIVANTKGEVQAEYASYVAQNKSVIESGKVVELTKMVAECKNAKQLNNVKMIVSLIETGEYKKSTSPLEKFSDILYSDADCDKFASLYSDFPEEALLGLKELNEMFPGIDVTKDTYVLKRNNKKNQK